jgi:hypothetical protein
MNKKKPQWSLPLSGPLQKEKEINSTTKKSTQTNRLGLAQLRVTLLLIFIIGNLNILQKNVML